MRLSFLIFFINMPAIAYSLLSEDRTASTVGLLLAYAMNLSANAVDVTLWANHLETKMISVERVFSFTKIEPEPGYQDYCRAWTSQEEGGKSLFERGEVEFD